MQFSKKKKYFKNTLFKSNTLKQDQGSGIIGGILGGLFGSKQNPNQTQTHLQNQNQMNVSL